MNIDDENISTNYLLSLKEIASWDNLFFQDITPPIIANIPALQRGLVWKPKQIELLWDSIMRGIPIGSFVVCSKIDSQQRQNIKIITHHLLDGQQRCNAITLGFTPLPKEGKDSIIWIDLSPKSLPSSTRNFLIRITTQAHPWGYTESDSEQCLSATQIRESLKKYLNVNKDEIIYYCRPAPRELRPYSAQVPVPLSFLLNSDISNAEIFWQTTISKLKPVKTQWSTDAEKFINSIESTKQKEKIFNGIKTALAAKIIALKAPDELVEESEQERNNSSQTANTSNIEHLFQRLNQQGTRLEGEELTYSMIKAYWPQLAVPIDVFAHGRMPASRMVSLAVRIALSDEEQLHGGISVSRIRKIAKEDAVLKPKILDFIGSENNSPLQNACICVDKWLGLEENCTSWGVLKVHRTSIAINSPDVYLLLLWLAYRYPNTQQEMHRQLTGMATLMHWYGIDNAKLANIIFKHCKHELTTETIVNSLLEGKNYLLPMHSPDELSNSLKISAPEDEKALSTWNWWNCFVEGELKEQQREREKNWWPFICKTKGNKEMLLYAQRKFLAERFPDYDPAKKDLWESHNRPWDYDHILPSYYTYCQRGNFKDFCCQWISTICNFRAWPFEDNRSDQKDTAKQKMIEAKFWDNSFIAQEEQDGFNHGADVINNANSSYSFATTCKSRLIRIYREWYESLDIGLLLPK